MTNGHLGSNHLLVLPFHSSHHACLLHLACVFPFLHQCTARKTFSRKSSTMTCRILYPRQRRRQFEVHTQTHTHTLRLLKPNVCSEGTPWHRYPCRSHPCRSSLLCSRTSKNQIHKFTSQSKLTAAIRKDNTSMVEAIRARAFSHVAPSPECGAPWAAYCVEVLWAAKDKKKNESIET